MPEQEAVTTMATYTIQDGDRFPGDFRLEPVEGQTPTSAEDAYLDAVRKVLEQLAQDAAQGAARAPSGDGATTSEELIARRQGAAGGDGTIGTVAGLLAGTGVPLGARRAAARGAEPLRETPTHPGERRGRGRRYRSRQCQSYRCSRGQRANVCQGTKRGRIYF